MVVIEKQNMYVLIVKNEKKPELKRIPNRLETLRKIIGNEYIDVIKYKDVLIVFDEEGYKKLLPINRTIDGLNIRGNIVITGNDEKNQDFKDLTKEKIEEILTNKTNIVEMDEWLGGIDGERQEK